MVKVDNRQPIFFDSDGYVKERKSNPYEASHEILKESAFIEDKKGDKIKFFAIESDKTISVIREDQSKSNPIVDTEEPINIEDLVDQLKNLDN